MTSEINTVKAFFTSIQVHLSNIWLESCINWCKTENLPPNYTPKELQSKVYEQWLLLDLRDIEVPVLPPNLSTQKHFTLNGNFCLQMMQIVDISKPKLWQLQKIRNSNALTRGTQQDSDLVGTGKRLLQMTLTDGVQEVEAMEYRLVPCLSLNLAPGTKIRVMGPVVVRRGRLMLEQQNVKILGGEVEELLVSHAAENVLARSLKLPENANPAVIQEKLLVVEQEEKDEGYVSNFQISKIQPPAPPPKPKVVQVLDVSEEEELMMAQEFDLLMEEEAKPPKLNKSQTPDLFEEPDFDALDFENINRSSTSTQVCQRQPKKNLELTLSDDDFDNIDIDAQLEGISDIEQNIFTITKLLQMMGNTTKGVFKIKARFKGVEEKFTVADGVFKLVIKVGDESGDLIVGLHSDVISVFVGCSPQDVINLKNDVVGKKKEAVEKMMEILMRVKDKLVELDNVMVVQLEKNKLPVVTKLVE